MLSCKSLRRPSGTVKALGLFAVYRRKRALSAIRCCKAWVALDEDSSCFLCYIRSKDY